MKRIIFYLVPALVFACVTSKVNNHTSKSVDPSKSEQILLFAPKSLKEPADPPKEIELKPSDNPDEGLVFTYMVANSRTYLQMSVWTWSGTPGVMRFVIKFPTVETRKPIEKAILKLHGRNDINNPFWSITGSNTDFFIQRIIEPWDTLTMNWNNQPQTTNSSQVLVPHSVFENAGEVLEIDVTGLVKEMSLTENFGFLFKLKDEINHASRTFYGSRWPDSSKHPSLILYY